MQPAANRSDEAARRLAEMKLDLLTNPVYWKQCVMLANLSQGNREFGPRGNTKYNRGSIGVNEIH